MQPDEVDKVERSSLSPNPNREEGTLMMVAYAREFVERCSFSKAEEGFGRLITILNGEESAAMTMSEIEVLIHGKLQGDRPGIDRGEDERGWYALRYQEPVIGSDGVVRTQREWRANYNPFQYSYFTQGLLQITRIKY